MARIPKLGAQWKIIYDFKPTEYSTFTQGCEISLCIRGLNGGIGFNSSRSCLIYQDEEHTGMSSNELPKIGEWTRLEISHEEKEGKFFLSLAIGDKEVAKKEMKTTRMAKLTDVEISIGWQPGFIKRLLVLEKH